MRLSRPCYDKPHRCPGWAGGGMRYAKVSRCDSGHLPPGMYDRRGWVWRFHRCTSCNLLVLPYAVHWIDPRWWRYALGRVIRDARYRFRSFS